MKFWDATKLVGDFIGGLMGKKASTDESVKSISDQAISTYLNYFTFAVRAAMLGVALFIFMYWPVDGDYNGDSFDLWSKRMTDLPDEVWYFLLTMILGWTGTEMVSSRSRSAIKMKAIDAISNTSVASMGAPSSEPAATPAEGEDFMQMGDEPGMSGRVTLDDEDEELFKSVENPSITQWRQNETQ